MPVVGIIRKGDDDDEDVTVDMCDRVAALSPEAELIVKWALRMEDILHRIEEFPEHEPHYPEDERYNDPRTLADAVLAAPINKPLSRHLKHYLTTPLGKRKLPPMNGSE